MAWMTEGGARVDVDADLPPERPLDAVRVHPLEDLPRPRTRLAPSAVASIAAALVGALLGVALRGSVRGVSLLAGGAAIVGVFVAWEIERRRRVRRAREVASAPRVLLDKKSLVLVDASTTTLLKVDEPFGATLFATPARDLVVLALTHRDGVAFVGGRRPSGRHRTDLLERALTTPASDLPIGAGIPIFARADRLLDLVADLLVMSRGALERVFLSDASMGDVVLDGAKLRAAQLDFDLKNKLNWRSFTFQEGSTLAASCYQATAIRQGDREVVLVALSPTGEIATPSIPPDSSLMRDGPLGREEIQRALARDMRLARGLADMPPPRPQRVAIDRLFMPRLRLALDAAPQDRLPTPARVATPLPTETAPTPPEGIDQLRSSRP